MGHAALGVIDGAGIAVYRYRAATMSNRIAILLCLLTVCPATVGAQVESWLEVRTPNFLVVTNSNEKEGRRAARQFEGMRSVFQRVFPDADLNTPEPMLVMAVQDKKTLQTLEPASFVSSGPWMVVGLFLPAAEKNYVLILLNAPGQHPYGPIYHEYAHFVFSRTHQWMPLWFTEGIAEFYQNTEIQTEKIVIGKGEPYLQTALETKVLLPLTTLFAVDQHSPYYHEADKTSIFYPESWALTHYLKDKDEREGTHQVADYLDLLQKNEDPTEAARQSFGDLDQLELALRVYAVQGKYGISELSGATEVDDSSWVVQPLTALQVAARKAEFMAHAERGHEARALLQDVLREDPANAQARLTMGYIEFRAGNYDAAQKWCREAVKLDPANYVAHFFYAAAAIKKGEIDQASRASVEESLRTAIKINPTFAPAYDALAMFDAMQAMRLEEARDLIEKAVQMEPGVPEIRVDEAQILSTTRQTKEAVRVLELAVKMAHTPEQTAAVENLLQELRRMEAEKKSVAISMQKVGGTGANARGMVNETPPKAIYMPAAEYTDEARKARLQGTCVVTLVVGIDGKPSNIVVTKKLGMGLDERAVEAVGRWKFQPGMRNGRPTISHLTLSLKFELFGGDVGKYFDLSEKAKAGDPAAEFQLANAFFDGRDIPKDEKQGMALLERAARSGWPEAQVQMGDRIYGDGNDSESYVEAYVWYAMAQRNGAAAAESKIAALEARMTPDQVTDAKKRVEATVVERK